MDDNQEEGLGDFSGDLADASDDEADLNEDIPNLKRALLNERVRVSRNFESIHCLYYSQRLRSCHTMSN